MINEHSKVKLANDTYSNVLGYVYLLFKVDQLQKETNVSIIPALEADYYFGSNFMRVSFRAQSIFESIDVP